MFCVECVLWFNRKQYAFAQELSLVYYMTVPARSIVSRGGITISKQNFSYVPRLVLSITSGGQLDHNL